LLQSSGKNSGGIKLKKYIIIMLVLASILLVGCNQQENTITGEAIITSNMESIKIGYIGPLTGEASIYGVSSKGGLEIAVNEINSKGGISGRKVELIVEDAKCSGKEAVTAATKLIESDEVVAIVGGICSGETLAASPVAESSKTILLSPMSSSPDITDAGDYIFRIWPSDNLQGKMMAEYVANKGHKKIAVVYRGSDWATGLADTFKQEVRSAGSSVVVFESFSQEEYDFKTILLKVKNSDATALYLPIHPEELSLMIKQIKEIDLDIEMFGAETFKSDEFLEESGSLAEGLVFMIPKFDETKSSLVSVLESYKELYGKESPFVFGTATGYDSMMLLYESLSNDIVGNGLKEDLYSVKDYDGVSGTLSIDENGDVIKDFQFMKIQDSEFVKI
jgi:branched-chain amino acid transport system substrate-binding protein